MPDNESTQPGVYEKDKVLSPTIVTGHFVEQIVIEVHNKNSYLGKAYVNEKSSIIATPSDILTFEAIPYPDAFFFGWYVDGVEISKLNPYKSAVEDDTLFEARFKNIEYDIYVKYDYYLGRVDYPYRVIHGRNANLYAKPKEHGVFLGWYENGELLSENMNYFPVITENHDYHALFGLDSHLVQVKAVEGGMTSLSTFDQKDVQSAMIQHGKMITLKVRTDPRYYFLGWYAGDEYIGSKEVQDIRVEDDLVYEAKFSTKTYTIDLLQNNGGIAEIQGYGTYYRGPFNQDLVLIVQPDEGYRFVALEDVYTGRLQYDRLSMTSPYEMSYRYRPVFEALPLVEIKVENEGEGVATVNGESRISVYKYTDLTFVAQPAPGYLFQKWSSTLRSKAYEDKTYTAIFVKGVEISAVVDDEEKGTAEVNGLNKVTVATDSQVNLVARPKDNFRFIAWYVRDVIVSTDINLSVRASENAEYLAVFAQVNPNDNVPEDEVSEDEGPVDQPEDEKPIDPPRDENPVDEKDDTFQDIPQGTPSYNPINYVLTVNIMGEGRVPGFEGETTFNQGTNVYLVPIPNNGSEFVGWTGQTQYMQENMIVMSQNLTVTAVFEKLTENEIVSEIIELEQVIEEEPLAEAVIERDPILNEIIEEADEGINIVDGLLPQTSGIPFDVTISLGIMLVGLGLWTKKGKI